mgnify:FL=1
MKCARCARPFTPHQLYAGSYVCGPCLLADKCDVADTAYRLADEMLKDRDAKKEN